MTTIPAFSTVRGSSATRPLRDPLTIGLFVLAFLAHAVLLFVVIPKISSRLRPSYNQDVYTDGYNQLAMNLVDGNGYRMYPDTAKTLMREPGYPLFLAGIFYVFGNSFTAVKLANMLMAFAAAGLMVYLLRKLFSHALMILGPPLLFLFHPAILIAESRGGIEILYTLFLLLFMCTLYVAIRSNRIWHYVLSGGVLGSTLLVRSVPILFPVLVLGYLVVFERQEKVLVHLRNVALMIVAMTFVISPWIIRNYALTRKFVPTASVLGVSAQTGEYILTHHASNNRRVDTEAAAERNELARQLGYPFKEGYYQCFYSSVDELRFSDYLFHRVENDYRESPKLFLRIVLTNLGYFWVGGKTEDSIDMNLAVQLPFLILAAIGIVWFARTNRLKVVAPMILLILYSEAVCAPILAQARYSVPIIPYLTVLACIPLLAIQRMLANRPVDTELTSRD